MWPLSEEDYTERGCFLLFLFTFIYMIKIINYKVLRHVCWASQQSAGPLPLTMSFWIVFISLNGCHSFKVLSDLVNTIVSRGSTNSLVFMAYLNEWSLLDHQYSRSRFYGSRLRLRCFNATSGCSYWLYIWSYLQLRQIKHHNLLLGVHYRRKVLCQSLSLWWKAGYISSPSQTDVWRNTPPVVYIAPVCGTSY